MSIFKCKMCGGTLEINNNETVVVCEYCETQQTLPKLNDERRANLYDRANHFRRNNEFDKAMGIYEQILNEDTTDAEAYWSLVLCRYGIEYVEDPVYHKRIPTVNRAQFTSVFDDDNYKFALKNADSVQKSIYEAEAKAINEIQKGILEISQKEEPFDVFICYKETDNNGRRTPDSVLATELYHELTKEGFKVFFSRITLEDKLGTAYEPYIFAALNSAKVMVVLGTRQEYFNAVWVKNEWSRYLALIKNGEKKILIPAYRDMNPYNLPAEFSHLQAQDMSKLGFMQDLIRGIQKIISVNKSQTVTVKETFVASGAANIEPLLKRVFMFLEDKDWKSADEYCEKVLDINPECAQAYLGKLLSSLKLTNQKLLENCYGFTQNPYYKKCIRFADEALISELDGYLKYQENRKCYQEAVALMDKSKTSHDYYSVAKKFEAIKDFKDSKYRASKCVELAEQAIYNHKSAEYNRAENVLLRSRSSQDFLAASRLFERLGDFKDSTQKVEFCVRKADEQKIKEKDIEYNTAVSIINNANSIATDYSSARHKLLKLGDYKDSVQLAEECVRLSNEKLSAEKEFRYQKAKRFMDDVDNIISLESAKNIFVYLGTYKDSPKLFDECQKKLEQLKNKSLYDSACNKLSQIQNNQVSESVLRKEIVGVVNDFLRIQGYKDSKSKHAEAQSIFFAYEKYSKVVSNEKEEIANRTQKAKSALQNFETNLQKKYRTTISEAEKKKKECKMFWVLSLLLCAMTVVLLVINSWDDPVCYFPLLLAAFFALIPILAWRKTLKTYKKLKQELENCNKMQSERSFNYKEWL